MSNTNKNVVVRALKGKFADQVVFKKSNGHSIMANVPSKTTKQATVAQLRIRDEFRMAANYAKHAITNPQLLTLYQSLARNGQNAYSAALADFLTPPKVTTLDVSAYKGMLGGIIAVRAVDAYSVKEVNVSIKAADGSVLETGPAVLDSNGNFWCYTATKDANPVAGTIVTAIAKDNPGNSGTMSVTLT
jgi:hypothetical protein